jgi:hypothetical protein
VAISPVCETTTLFCRLCCILFSSELNVKDKDIVNGFVAKGVLEECQGRTDLLK